ncbi:PEP-CTERM sorting domain-containing protein [Rubrivivax albus]|uniref:PEP-CTERM sorting domain-containing protein n=1 Tax=Rubrivivax albus TaxID=2499835 RepID=A0A437K0V9_9BURK|nr:PEP-CTERM sorting domain-containing protein [Rubrivivax albus]RVT54006.1 PEP-CTERM sorting domain-containing protein [Rubrivivax albus]
MKQLVTGLGLAALTALVNVADAAPVAVSLPANFSLQAYTGTAAVNAGLLDADGVLWTVQEQARDGLQSWYLFFDPLNASRLRATVNFGAPIVAVYTTSAELAATQAEWSVDIDGDGQWNDYAAHRLMGLEGADTVNWAFGGTALTLDWRASDPGDHVRVLLWQPQDQTVPEPASAALALLGLGLAGALRRRTAR